MLMAVQDFTGREFPKELLGGARKPRESAALEYRRHFLGMNGRLSEEGARLVHYPNYTSAFIGVPVPRCRTGGPHRPGLGLASSGSLISNRPGLL